MTEIQTYPSNFNQALAEAPDLEQIQKELEQQIFSRPALGMPYAAPQTPTERALAEIWESVLHIEPVGIDDDFFMLGGHSILATQALARANELFDIDIPVSVFFSEEDFTVRALAKVVDQYQLSQLGEEELAALIEELEGLSEEEIQILLAGNQ